MCAIAHGGVAVVLFPNSLCPVRETFGIFVIKFHNHTLSRFHNILKKCNDGRIPARRNFAAYSAGSGFAGFRYRFIPAASRERAQPKVATAPLQSLAR
jgi:hypothetical protein